MNCSEILPTIIAVVPSAIVAIVSICQTGRMHREDRKERENKALAERIKHKLEIFYYPYLLLAKENTSLFEVFSKERLERNEDFRTLSSLLSNEEFSNNDNAILQRIIENDVHLKELINKSAHVVDDNDIREALVKSATHYSIIELAYNKKITGEVERFEPFVHPNDVYKMVEKKAMELEKEMLNAIPK